LGVLDVHVDKQGVRFAVYVFNGNLEAIKASCFGDCDFGDEVAAWIFVDDSVGGSKECKDVRDEVTFVGMEVEPVGSILREVDFLCCPERCFSFFVHLPNVVVFDGKEDQTIWIFLEDWLKREECVVVGVD
jgi:hypothetical protein